MEVTRTECTPHDEQHNSITLANNGVAIPTKSQRDIQPERVLTEKEQLKVKTEASEFINGLTEEQLKVKLEEARRERRRESNRKSAQRCRARKQAKEVNSQLCAEVLGLIDPDGSHEDGQVLQPPACDTLAPLAQQYREVAHTMHELADELKIAKEKRQQFATEVKFLNKKRRSFQRTPQLDGPSQAALELKSKETPQFFEAKLVDELYSTLMNCMVLHSKRL